MATQLALRVVSLVKAITELGGRLNLGKVPMDRRVRELGLNES